MSRALAWIAAFIVSAIYVGIFGTAVLVASKKPAHGRDAGQWEQSSPAVRDWYRKLMRPDAPMSPCCGEADAYWADDFDMDRATGQYIAIITDDREDAPLGRPHVKPGTRILIPTDKIKWNEGNPTGHGVIFLGTGLNPLCFVPGSGV